MATTAPTYDPKSTATQLATLSIQARQSILTSQNDVATATEKALSSLKSAMSSFEGAMSSLSLKKSVLATSATFSSAVGTASAGISATPGNYSFFVEQVATANQAMYSNLSDTTPVSDAGTINVNVGLTTFSVDLTQADTSGDGVLSIKELATAINGASGNTSKVTASTMTVGGVQQLVLASTETGADNMVSIDSTGVPSSDLQAALSDANRKDLTPGQNAVIYVGGEGSDTRIEQASNTFNVIDGVSMTFTKKQVPGESPVTLTVATDTAATAANVQGFVDGWNKLVSTLASLTDAGSVTDGTSPGVFHGDTGIQALRTRMQSLLRQQSGGLSLVNFGISGNRDGTLSLDSARLTRTLAANPGALDKIMGNNSLTAPSGVLGGLDKVLDGWTDITDGQITKRRDVNSQLQESLLDRQSRLDKQYETAYIRYLNQFTTLQTLQAQMDSNTSMFDAMFSKDD